MAGVRFGFNGILSSFLMFLLLSSASLAGQNNTDSISLRLEMQLIPKLSLTAPAGFYTMEWAQEIDADSTWQFLTNVTVTNKTVAFVDVAPVVSNRFYRAVERHIEAAPSSLVGKTLQLNYPQVGGEQFIFTSETSGLYENTETFRYEWNPAIGRVVGFRVDNVGSNYANYIIELSFDAESGAKGTAAVIYQEQQDVIPQIFSVPFTLLP